MPMTGSLTDSTCVVMPRQRNTISSSIVNASPGTPSSMRFCSKAEKAMYSIAWFAGQRFSWTPPPAL